jgi:hypothetical protein
MRRCPMRGAGSSSGILNTPQFVSARAGPYFSRPALRGPAGLTRGDESNLDPPVRIWPEIASLRSQ